MKQCILQIIVTSLLVVELHLSFLYLTTAMHRKQKLFDIFNDYCNPSWLDLWNRTFFFVGHTLIRCWCSCQGSLICLRPFLCSVSPWADPDLWSFLRERFAAKPPGTHSGGTSQRFGAAAGQWPGRSYPHPERTPHSHLNTTCNSTSNMEIKKTPQIQMVAIFTFQGDSSICTR